MKYQVVQPRWAYWLLDAGAPIANVSCQLGHESIKMTAEVAATSIGLPSYLDAEYGIGAVHRLFLGTSHGVSFVSFQWCWGGTVIGRAGLTVNGSAGAQ